MKRPPIFNLLCYISPVVFDAVDYQQLVLELTKANIQTILNPDLELTRQADWPFFILTIGPNWKEFGGLDIYPDYVHRRWLHYTNFAKVSVPSIIHGWIAASTPRHIDPPSTIMPKDPLVSIFTTTYKSGDKILIPYESLLKQTYTRWEWILVDDSDDDSFTQLLNLKDGRIKRFRPDFPRHYIGRAKALASRLCAGDILVELDHDDELVPEALEKIVKAFVANPGVGFVSADCSEIYWPSGLTIADGLSRSHAMKSNEYSKDFGFGYGAYWEQYLPSVKQWGKVGHITTLNRQTIQHLVGLPNHPRCWSRDTYISVGGHNPELTVADDYDLLIRTFLHTRWIHIPECLYIQYLWPSPTGMGSHTFSRNPDIQLLVGYLYNYYLDAIKRRMDKLNIPTLDAGHQLLYTTALSNKRRVSATKFELYDSGAIVIVDDSLDLDSVKASLESYQLVVVVGDLTKDHLTELRSLHHPRLRYWALGVAEKAYWKSYAKLICHTRQKKFL